MLGDPLRLGVEGGAEVERLEVVADEVLVAGEGAVDRVPEHRDQLRFRDERLDPAG